jgi:AcrR family transcriptional regulator
MKDDFTARFRELFEFGSMADIARQLGVPHATVRNYFSGRLPAPEVLIKIANTTGVSLNWLLIGTGEKFVQRVKPVDIGRMLEERIEQMIDQKLAARREGVQELGTVDEAPEFDVEAAIRSIDDPQKVMNEWFRHEGREYPSDYGVVFFQGWSSYTFEEKAEAIRDAKKVLDRTLKAK